jgi:hypothetical protein
MLGMRLHRLSETSSGRYDRHEPDGTMTRGTLFVGEDGIVRWVAVEEVLDMAGVGNFNGGSGYGVYESG